MCGHATYLWWGTTPLCLPSVYLMTCTWPNLPGLPPPHLYTANNQTLEVGMAWERGYRYDALMVLLNSWRPWWQLCTSQGTLRETPGPLCTAVEYLAGRLLKTCTSARQNLRGLCIVCRHQRQANHVYRDSWTYSNVLLLKAMQVCNVSVHLPYSFEWPGAYELAQKVSVLEPSAERIMEVSCTNLLCMRVRHHEYLCLALLGRVARSY